MPRFTEPMERRLGELEKEYDVVPQGQQEEGGLFGSRGFVGNIKNYYQTNSWGDWWRNLFRQTEETRPGAREPIESYPIMPGWGKSNTLAIIELMEGPEKYLKVKEKMEAREKDASSF